jgi:hypothetical protein
MLDARPIVCDVGIPDGPENIENPHQAGGTTVLTVCRVVMVPAKSKKFHREAQVDSPTPDSLWHHPGLL